MRHPAKRDMGDRNCLNRVAVRKAFTGTTVVSGMECRVGRGAPVFFFGSSGCETTLRHIIAGLTLVDKGDVPPDRRAITRVPAAKRKISNVFQSYALFPHVTVAENVAFDLRARRHAKADCRPKVAEAPSHVPTGDFADQKGSALTGGQQHLATTQALMVDPVHLLLDDPVSVRDLRLSETMPVELKTWLRDRNITTFFCPNASITSCTMGFWLSVLPVAMAVPMSADAVVKAFASPILFPPREAFNDTLMSQGIPDAAICMLFDETVLIIDAENDFLPFMLPVVIMLAAPFTLSAVYTLPPPEWALRWYQSLKRCSGLWEAISSGLILLACIVLMMGSGAVGLNRMIQK